MLDSAGDGLRAFEPGRHSGDQDQGDCQCAEGHSYLACSQHVLCASIRPSAAWELVTRDEFRRESAAPHNKTARAAAQPGAPIISVEEPNPKQRITAPVTVRITFRPHPSLAADLVRREVNVGAVPGNTG